MTSEEVNRRLDDRDCASLDDRPITCPGDRGRLQVTVSPTVGTLSDGTVTFTVENVADEPFMTNHYRWVLQKWDGSQWRRLAPLAVPGSLQRIPSGGSHTYRLSAIKDSVAHSQSAYIAESDITIGGLGPGVYGLSTHGYFKSTPDDKRAAAAVFGFAGKAPLVRPTATVKNIERVRSTLVVRANVPKDERGSLIVSFGGGTPDVQLLPEHVRQLSGLLNTLPYAATDGIDSVQYVGHADDIEMVDAYLSAVTSTDMTRYGFRDYVFEVTTQK
ncbi:hypothetical protein [Halorussus aquaticus]|uniref:Uncharacterized protein n=1 Tax=Halorussus aquaticus TaxID=2953748 RepID=A0ABD5Q451_9EURY|nr:hypothetical protein [Halorussus aquaticus]